MSESANTTEIIVPDIGDSESVEIIEILVSVGDSVSVDDSLLTLESDKASMEIPAAAAGVIESLTVKVGDTVNSGDVIGTMSGSENASSDSSSRETSAEVSETEQDNDNDQGQGQGQGQGQ